jgi:hypothetical protein
MIAQYDPCEVLSDPLPPRCFQIFPSKAGPVFAPFAKAPKPLEPSPWALFTSPPGGKGKGKGPSRRAVLSGIMRARKPVLIRDATPVLRWCVFHTSLRAASSPQPTPFFRVYQRVQPS